MNPEKGNQVSPPAPGIGKPQEDALRWPQLCAAHPEEHRRAGDGLHFVACPVCTLEANEKAYDRKARLAENAEEMAELLETIRNWHAEAMKRVGQGESGYVEIEREFPRGGLDALLARIER